MLLVDDHLALLILTGAVDPGELNRRVATTSLWYFRLVSAVTASPSEVRGPGQLQRLLEQLPEAHEARARILHPPSELIEVLHPMHFAVEMAQVQRERRLNLLGAETIGAAKHHTATILVATPNAGGPIEQAAIAEKIVYDVREG